MNWYKVQISCSKKESYAIEEMLIGYGALSISMSGDKNELIFESKIREIIFWSEIQISALFDKKIYKENISSILGLLKFSNLEVSIVKDIDWIEAYQQDFKSIKFGKRIWVVPSWEVNNKVKEGDITINLDPGMAFGTGSHETTHLCLEYLDSINLNKKTIVDYGCGSGILGIAAIKLGAKFAYGIDIDSQALSIGIANAKKNNISNMSFISPKKFKEKAVAELLIANILFKPLLDLRETLSNIIKDKSTLVLSGILENQVDNLIHEYKKDFDIISLKKKNDWCLLEMIKK